MSAKEKDLVARLLKQSILTICKETISYNDCLEIDGIICISLENDTQHIVIKVHEQFQKLRSHKSDDSLSIDSDGYTESAVQSWASPISVSELNDEEDESTIIDDENSRINDENNSDDIEMKFYPGEDDVEGVKQPGSFIMPIIPKLVDRQVSKHNTERMYAKKRVPLYTSVGSGKSLNDGDSSEGQTSKAVMNCKRCSMTLEDKFAYEEHNLLIHSAFTCQICYSTFTCRNNLKRHTRLHTGYKPFRCPRCPESFTRKDDIKRHILRHNYAKPYRCSICGKGYMDRNCVRNHMRRDHISRLLHVCPQCGEAFNNTTKFQEHKKCHPELKGYQCTLCDFTGTNALMYHKHMLTHGRQKMYLCLMCRTEFSDPFAYTVHLKTHRLDKNCKAYSCCFCESQLQTYDQFARHEHAHVQGRTHNCNICSKQFRYPANLKEHLMTHSVKDGADASSQYWCTECQQGFSSEDKLQEHIYETHEGHMPDPMPDAMRAENEDAHKVTGINRDSTLGTGTGVAVDQNSEAPQSDAIRVYGHSPRASPTSTTTDVMNSSDPNGSKGDGVPNHIAILPKALSTDPSSPIKLTEETNTQESPKSVSPVLGESSSSELNFIKQEVLSDAEDLQNSEEVNLHSDHSLSISDPVTDTKLICSDFSGTSMVPRLNRGPYIVSSVRSPGFERVITPTVLFRTKAPFECEVCDDIFQDFDSFDHHSSSAHRRFICDYCGKVFTAKPNRERHVRYHTGEKPYRCDLCDQTFFRGDDLKYHRTTRHSNVKPFVCSICGLSFAWPKDLERHIRTHTHN